jgi:hypothetical protein
MLSGIVPGKIIDYIRAVAQYEAVVRKQKSFTIDFVVWLINITIEQYFYLND